ncbi:MAG TPA: DEAD/DEAH box helicase [Bacteroidales bacterium]|nr:DEAD/DEAH box helicase [Bacteroidales bacterium]HSA44020.1 DEAD/DEAH box helicase [Bacteroidales bacterium]
MNGTGIENDSRQEGPAFVLLFFGHRKLGMIFGGAVVTKNTGRTEQGPALLDKQSSLAGFLDKEALEIIDLSESCSDTALCKHFARNQSANTFIRELDEQTLRRFVRPYIDRQIHKALRIALEHHYPLWIREDRAAGGECHKLTPAGATVIPVFHFTSIPEGIAYRIELSLDGIKIPLPSPGISLISQHPCLLRYREYLCRLPETFEGIRLIPFLSKPEIRIPAASERQYLETFVMKSIQSGDIIAEGFDVKDLDIDPVAELSFEKDWQDHAVLIVWFRYGNKRIMAGQTRPAFVELNFEGEKLCFTRIKRKSGLEKEFIRKLKEEGLTSVNENTLSLRSYLSGEPITMTELACWINAHDTFLEENRVLIIQAEKEQPYFTGSSDFKINTVSSNDWFDIHGSVRFGNFEFPFLALRPNILAGKREFLLPDNSIAVIPQAWFTRLQDIFLFGTPAQDSIRIRKHHFTLLEDTAVFHTVRGFRREEALAATNTFNQPPGLKTTLRSYQAEGLQWLLFQHQTGLGACLADDMGLGKTVQVLAFLLSLPPGDKPSLLVMPASLIHHWTEQIHSFAPELTLLVHSGPDRHGSTQFFGAFNLILTTYGTCRNDIEWLADYPFLTVILDESQLIKNPDAKITQAVQRLQAVQKIVVTGTPIENSLTDLWSQMNFIQEGLLGTQSWFKNNLGGKNGDIPEEAIQKRLKKLTAPFILRRRKEEVEKELPPLTHIRHYCEMEASQKQIYDEEKSAIRNLLIGLETQSGEYFRSIHLLRSLVRLRQIAIHPGLVREGYIETSTKTAEILDHIRTLAEENHKVLVFSSFVRYLDYLAMQLTEMGLSWSLLTGSTADRGKVVHEFQQDTERKVFLMSLKAGGKGLNLQQASYVFLTDPWWNPAAEEQAIHRAHRIGVQHGVFAYRFITKGTVEEKIIRLQQQKLQLAGTFITSGNPLKDLSREETAWLFE